MTAMPPTPRPADMTPAELVRLLDAAGLADLTRGKQAAALGVARSHLYRWLDGTTPISAANAMLIRSKLTPKRKKK